MAATLAARAIVNLSILTETDMAKDQPTFEINSGPYRQKVDAPSPEQAIDIFWQGKDRGQAGALLRFREIAWNTNYRWDRGTEKRRGSWYYVSAAPLSLPAGEMT